MRLPNFLLIGAAKSGTTSLYEYLKQHPQVFMSPAKEPNYFAYGDGNIGFGNPDDNRFLNRQVVKDLESYQRLFAAATDQRVLGEASGSSMYRPGAHTRIRALVPGAKLLAVLREPAERAYSQFHYYCGLRVEHTLRFHKALALEPRRIRAGWAPYWFYTTNGFYYRQLKPFYDEFPANQIQVYLYDDLKRDPRALMKEIFTFLDVDPAFEVNLSTTYNASSVPVTPISRVLYKFQPDWAKVRPYMPGVVKHIVRAASAQLKDRYIGAPRPMSAGTRRKLRELFRDDVLRLQGLIGRDLSHWLA